MPRASRTLLILCAVLHALVPWLLLASPRHVSSARIWVVFTFLAALYAIAAYATAHPIRWGRRIGLAASGLESLVLVPALGMILYFFFFGRGPQHFGTGEWLVALALPLHLATFATLSRANNTP